MKTYPFKTAEIGLIMLVLLSAAGTSLYAQGSSNSWISPFSGKWEVSSDWSAGLPSSTESIFITNSGTKTVTIDANTSGSFSNSLFIHDLTLAASTNASTNFLSLSNAGTATPLQITSSLTVGSGVGTGVLTISNSALQVGSALNINLGSLTLNSGTLIASNAITQIGLSPLGSSSLVVNGGTSLFGSTIVGENSGAFGSWTINGGTNVCRTDISVGGYGAGLLTMNSGLLFVTNSGGGILSLGNNGLTNLGVVVVSNGELHTLITYVGQTSQGVVDVNGGLMTVASNLVLGVTNGASGSALITGGTLAVTNSTHNAFLDVRRGSVTLNGGLLQVDSLILTNGGSFTNLAGTLQYTGSFEVDNGSSINIGGGAVVAATNFTIGSVAGSNSSVTLTGGSLTVTNAPLLVGSASSAIMTVSSNATVTVQTMKLGSAVPGASGTLVMNGGTLHVTKLLSVNSTNSVDLKFSGYDVILDGSSASLNIGDDSPGAVNADSTGYANFESINVGTTNNGTYEQSAMQIFVSGQMIVGTNCLANGAVGTALMNGGQLYVTNASGTAALVVINGTFVLGPGATLVADNLIITNSCARFQNNGGTVTAANIVLSPNLDADGDGVSNASEQAAGTDPLNPASYFHILKATKQGSDAVISWVGAPSRNFYVQACTSAARVTSGNFANVSPLISGTSTGTNTYTVHGGATGPTVFYRILLVP